MPLNIEVDHKTFLSYDTSITSARPFILGKPLKYIEAAMVGAWIFDNGIFIFVEIKLFAGHIYGN